MTVLFADIVGFTQYCENTDSATVVAELHRVFGELDRLAEREGIEKIKTIGDCYMVVGGLFCDELQTMEVLRFAAEARILIKDLNSEWRLRVGVSFGDVTAGIIGSDKLIYDIWGDVVNLASRMESNSEPDRILVTREVKESAIGNCRFSEPKRITVKGKAAPVEAYFLELVA